MHKNNFVVCVKVGNKILRETKDVVPLPFGTEYKVFLKNIDSRRAMAKVTIDGDDIMGERWLVLEPNDSLDLERFVRNGNLNEGNRLKFIERTKAVEEGRGVKAEDGLIRVEFKFEQAAFIGGLILHNDCFNNPTVPNPFAPPVFNPWQQDNHNIMRCQSTSLYSACAESGGVLSANSVSTANVNDAGITVPGSVSDQKFQDVWGFPTGPSEVVTLRLVGREKNQPVAKVRTVDVKPRCVTCKNVGRANAKFCSQCGTSLEIV